MHGADVPQSMEVRASKLLPSREKIGTNINTNVNASNFIKSANSNNSKSEETIYERAVAMKNRGSSSSKEENLANIGDELIEVQFQHLNVLSPKVAGPSRNEVQVTPPRQPRASRVADFQIAHHSRQGAESPMGRHQPYITPEQRADERIRDAEMNKTVVFPTSGKVPSNNVPGIIKQFAHTALIDEEYITVGNHVDEVTLSKIKKGDYVDFGKLIPKDRILAIEENRMELIMKGGHTYYVPVSESTEINSFNKWEQAFRVYANIYVKFNPHRSAELIEYNHVIHTISLSYPWENVYLYDKDFRIHIAKHPERSWSIILQQAWSLRLRERTNHLAAGNHNHNGRHSGEISNVKTKGGGSIDDYCRRYNKGRCPFGSGCRFEHRCQYCHKFGHGILNCHKLAADLAKERSKPNKHHWDHSDDSSNRRNSGNGHYGQQGESNKRKAN